MRNLLDIKPIATREALQWVVSKIYELPNPDIVLNKAGEKIDVLKELSYDPHIYSCIQSRKSGILSLEWEINQGQNKDDRSYFVENILKELDLDSIISSILDAPLFGYSICEIYWRYENKYLIPKQIIQKPHNWFYFDHKGICWFRGLQENILAPNDKFLIIVNKPLYDNPYGESVLSRCFYPWLLKKETTKFWSIFTEKFSMPYIVGKTSVGSPPETVENLLDAIAELRQGGSAAIEGDTTIEVIDPSGAASPAIYGDFIHFFNAEVSKAILSQTLTTEQGDSGSYAMSQTHLQVRKDVIDSDKKLVEGWINYLIKLIIKINFGDDDGNYPNFILYEETDVDSELATVVSGLVGTGQIRFTEKFFNTRFGFKSEEFEIVTPQPEAAGFAEDSEGADGHKHTDEVDTLTAIGLNDFAKTTEMLLKPVLNLIEQGSSYDDILEQTIALYPHLDTEKIEEILAQGILIANTAGRLEAAK